jgi:hypothetical protein
VLYDGSPTSEDVAGRTAEEISESVATLCTRVEKVKMPGSMYPNLDLIRGGAPGRPWADIAESVPAPQVPQMKNIILKTN